MHIALAACVSHCQNKTSLLRAKLPRCDIHSGTHFRMSSVTLVHPNGRSGDCGDTPLRGDRGAACRPARRGDAPSPEWARARDWTPRLGQSAHACRRPTERGALSCPADSCRRDVRTGYRRFEFFNRLFYAVLRFLSFLLLSEYIK